MIACDLLCLSQGILQNRLYFETEMSTDVSVGSQLFEWCLFKLLKQSYFKIMEVIGDTSHWLPSTNKQPYPIPYSVLLLGGNQMK